MNDQILDVVWQFFNDKLSPDEQVRLAELLNDELLENPEPFLKAQLHNCIRGFKGFWFSTLREYQQIKRRSDEVEIL